VGSPCQGEPLTSACQEAIGHEDVLVHEWRVTRLAESPAALAEQLSPASDVRVCRVPS
jgi:hypothetical protein